MKTYLRFALIGAMCASACTIAPPVETPAPMDDGGATDPPDPIDPDAGVVPDPGDDGPDPYAPHPASLEPNDALGFFDVDANRNPRTIRRDLVGTLPGMVQFAQSHTVDPSGNTARNLPTLVAERAALVLVTPDLAGVNLLELELQLGERTARIPMRHPNELYPSDSTNGDGRVAVTYSKRAWSAVIPWDFVSPGVSIVVRDGRGNEGRLAGDAIDFAAPATVVLQQIRVGMLSDPPTSDEYDLLDDTAAAATDYFSTIPAALLAVGTYEAMRLDRVMIADGTIYTTTSADEGGVYDGDMRQDVAKTTISSGIDCANQGVTSASMGEESNPRVINIVTIHHAQGRYTNGVQQHGLSGGAGIATLYGSVGNEFSHELGHNWGLGHYPGSVGDDYFWSAHHADSGWGFVGHRLRMRGNLDWTGSPTTTTVNGVAATRNFAGAYSYALDAMSGGRSNSAVSRYTHHTGYSALRIQQHFDRANPDPASPTGYRRWNEASRRMEPSTEPNVRAPVALGVPVYTFLGGYDPSTRRAVLYPAFRGNYGHVFDLPAPATSGDACWLEVGFASGTTQRIAIAATRHRSGSVNRLAVNVAASRTPRSAKVACRIGGVESELGAIAIPTPPSPMPPAVVVGRDHGFSAIAATEVPALERALLALANDTTPVLDADAAMWLEVHGVERLTAEARTIALRVESTERAVQEVARFALANAASLDRRDPVVEAELVALVRRLGLAEDANHLLPPTSRITVDGGACLSVDAATSTVSVVAQSGCTEDPGRRFVMDARGAIHPASDAGLCLAGGANGERIALTLCDDASVAQSFVPRPDATLRPRTNTSLAIDYARSSGMPILYSAHGGANQQWSGVVVSTNPLLARLGGESLRRVARVAGYLE